MKEQTDFEDIAKEFADSNCKYQSLRHLFSFFVIFHSQRLKHRLFIVELNAVEVKSLDSLFILGLMSVVLK